MISHFLNVKEGDTVKRLLAEQLPMELKVCKVTEKLIYCGPWEPEQCWTFDRETGIEEDPDLGWGVKAGVTGSRLVHEWPEGIDLSKLKGGPHIA